MPLDYFFWVIRDGARIMVVDTAFPVSTGGRREGVPIIAKAAVAAGADGVFLEFHPEPDKALCDAPSCLPLDGAAELLTTLKALHQAARS